MTEVTNVSSLSAQERSIIAVCSDAFFPGGGSLPVSGAEAGVVAYLDALIVSLPWRTRVPIRALLQLLEHAPCLLFSPRLTRQSAASRVRTLKAWEASRFYFQRICIQSIRTLLGLAYMASPLVAGRLGMIPDNDPFCVREAA